MCLCEIKWDNGKGLEILLNQVIGPLQMANQLILGENYFDYNLDNDQDKVLLHFHYHLYNRLGDVEKILNRFLDELKL